jgi:hypothetical protein
MHVTLLSILLLVTVSLQAQDGTTPFNNKIKLMEGFYTSTFEILENSPKYPDIEIESKSSFWIGGYTKLYYFDSSGQKQDYDDTLVFLVYDKQRFVYYKNDFHKLILTGPVSTFMIERVHVEPNTGYKSIETKLLFWDLETGKISKLTPDKFDAILQRDSDLYSRYSRLSKGKKKDTLYYYLLQYNERNPVYINM